MTLGTKLFGAALLAAAAAAAFLLLESGVGSTDAPASEEPVPPVSKTTSTHPMPRPTRRRAQPEDPAADADAEIAAAWNGALALHRTGKSIEALTELLPWRTQRAEWFAEAARAALLREMEHAALALLSRASRSASLYEVRRLAAAIREVVKDPALVAQVEDLVAAAERRVGAAMPGVGGDIVERAEVVADKEAIARHLQRFAGMGPAAKKKDWVDEQLARLEQANLALAKEPDPLAVADPIEAEKRRLDQLEKLRQRDAAGLLDHIGGALAWLALHQADDGHFGADATAARCKALGHDPACVSGGNERKPLAATGLAVLAFLDFRDQDVKRLFEPTLARGIAWLVAQQRKDGSFKPSGYEAAIGLMALGQAAASSRSDELRAAVERGLAYYAQHHGPDGGYWYALDPTKTSDQDLSVTGWFVQALEAGTNAGAKAPEGMAENLRRFVQFVTRDIHSYGYHVAEPERMTLAPVGMLCRSILEADAAKLYGDDWRAFLAAGPPKGMSVNVYVLYYCVRVLLALDGKLSPGWRTPLTALAGSQQSTGTAAGQIPLPKDFWFGRGDVGPTIATAFATLTLEHALYRR